MAHLYLLMVVWVVLHFCGLLIYQRRGNRAVGSGGFLSYACYCLSLLRGWCVVYVGDARDFLSSTNRFHFQTQKLSWNEHKPGHRPLWDSKTRMTLLTRTSTH
jgi:hypothetical protein